MSLRDLKWLAAFQSRFGAAVRTPLDRGAGTLRAVAPTDVDLAALGIRTGPNDTAAAGLGVYQRQYWYRLFDVMQTAYPLVARLLGYWEFNGYAARFLHSRPPQGWDIDAAAEGFEAFLSAALADDSGERSAATPYDFTTLEAWIQALRIDAAYRRITRAPERQPYRPAAEDAPRLMRARLVPSPAVALVAERWPLLALRRSLASFEGEAPLALPPPAEHPRHWALIRRSERTAQIPLEAREAELLQLLGEHPLPEALAMLEGRCDERELYDLPARAQAWLARSVELEFWVGVEGSD